LLLVGNGSIANSANITMYGIVSGQRYAGYIDVLGRVDQTLTLASGQTLRGDNGSFINGSLIATAGSTVTPGGANNVQYTSVSNNMAFQAGSTNRMDISKASGILTNDLLNVTGTLTRGGTLVINKIGADLLTAGDTFKVFNAGNLSGTFDTVVSQTPGQAVTWNMDVPTPGQIQVATAVATTPPTLTSALVGNNLNISWPADYLGWRLMAQTNQISAGLTANWVLVPNSETVTSVSIPVDQANPTVFFKLTSP
jgi:hypothetical protein